MTSYMLRVALLTLAGLALLFATDTPATFGQSQGMRALVIVIEPTANAGSASGAGSYAEGTEVTVTPTANEGWRFERWYEDCTGVGTCTVTMDTGRTVKARFKRVYTVSVATSPAVGGSISTHISPVTTDGMLTFDAGTSVTITATPSSGWRFQGWSGSGCSGRGACTVVMSEARTVTAEFVPILSLTVTPSTCGTLYTRRGDEQVRYGAIGDKYFPHNTSVTVTQAPVAGCTFSAWSGDCTGTSTCQVTMSQGRSVTATFTRNQYTLTRTASPALAAPSTLTSSLYTPNAVVTSHGETARSGWRFARWSGDCTGATCSLTMTQDYSITANYVRVYTLSTSVAPSGAGVINHGSHAPGTLDAGTSVTLTAVPNLGYRLQDWSGDAACTAPGACSFTMDQNRTVKATFTTTPTRRLISRAQPSAGGTVSGSGSYNHGTDVTVSATPNTNYVFVRWSGACTGTGACEVSMTTTRIVLAVFGYALTTTASPSNGGTVSGAGSYGVGRTVTVTATPATGYAFSGWSGACTGTGTCSVTMSAARDVTATFVPTYALTATVSPAGGGSVSLSPSGGTYSSGTDVTVTATPATGYAFSAWSGACTGTGTCTVTMPAAAASVTATFVRTYALTTTASPAGGGRFALSPSGGTYNDGTVVGVTVQPLSGYRFDRWSGGCTGTGTCSVTMSQARDVTAHFVRTYGLVATPSPAAGGTVTGSGRYDTGTNVTVTYTANAGYRFVEWGLGCSGTGTCTVAMTTHRHVVAKFVATTTSATYTLTLNKQPHAGGSVSQSGTSPYTAGSSVTITATPNSGYTFAGWNGGCGQSTSCTFTINSNRLFLARFAVSTPALTTAAVPSGGGTVTGGGNHAYNERVAVTATPNTGYRFDRWSGACTGSGACSVTMSTARSVTAHFVRTYTLTTTASPAIGGVITGGGAHDTGTAVTLTATPNVGYRFFYWSGWCAGTGGCSLTMTADRSVTAHFDAVATGNTLTTTASPSGGGSVTGAGIYSPGDSATVTATPATGYRFDRWSGACTGSGACEVAMSQVRSVTAIFVRQYTLTTTAEPAAGGTITGAGAHDIGTAVTVTATANTGFSFLRWSGACTGTGACSVTMSADRSVTAHFEAVATGAALTVVASPSEGGSVTGGGIYAIGTLATVTATANTGYRFQRWSGDCTGTGACQVTMTVNQAVTAHFVRQYVLTASAVPSGGGSVSGGGTYDAGRSVTVTATANTGYRFERWAGDCSGTGACSVTMSAARTVTAHFLRQYVLTTTASPSAGGTVTGAGTYDTGESVTVTATANTGYRFASWAGDCTGTGTCTVTMSEARSVRANFVPVGAGDPGEGNGDGGNGGNGGTGGGPQQDAPQGQDTGVTVDAAGRLAVTASVRGDAPRRPVFRFRYTCADSGGFALTPGQTGRFFIAADASCTLTVIDGEGAASVSGRLSPFPFTTDVCAFSLDGATGDLFADRPFVSGEYVATAVFEWDAEAGTVDVPLARGSTVIAWPGARRVLNDGWRSLASAIYAWDTAGQRWLSWFPGGDALGVNTLRTFEPGGIYVIVDASATRWRVETSDAAEAPSVVRLVRGSTFIAWPGGRVSIDAALGSLASSVTAVHTWDGNGQRWLSWFPGSGELGVNTISFFEPGGVYFITARDARDWRVPDDVMVGEGDLPAC